MLLESRAYVPTPDRDARVFVSDLGETENRLHADWLAGVRQHLEPPYGHGFAGGGCSPWATTCRCCGPKRDLGIWLRCRHAPNY